MEKSSMTQFLVERAPDLWNRTLEHFMLTGISVGIAILIGLTLGFWISRNSLVRSPILGISGIVQTVPSLALLGFLLPFLGIGVKPAIVALSLYAILPIIRNTYTGITEVPPEVIEAAKGMGFTDRQQLFLVELPLAMPVIIAGIRTATVISVGVATLAAFIGAGGLGFFIFRGISMGDNRLIMLGAIPAALMALLLDFIIGLIERTLQRGT
ncbi:MAG: ABC transporter permease [Candidatus Glassbacteria bacterium]